MDQQFSPEEKLVHKQVLETTHTIENRVHNLEFMSSAVADRVDKISKDTEEILELFKDLKGAFKSIERLAAVLKPIGVLAVAFSAIYGSWDLLKAAFLHLWERL